MDKELVSVGNPPADEEMIVTLPPADEEDSSDDQDEEGKEKGVFEAASEMVGPTPPFKIKTTDGQILRFWKSATELERIHPGAVILARR